MAGPGLMSDKKECFVRHARPERPPLRRSTRVRETLAWIEPWRCSRLAEAPMGISAFGGLPAGRRPPPQTAGPGPPGAGADVRPIMVSYRTFRVGARTHH